MNEVPLDLKNLAELDFNKIGAAFNAERERVVNDCLDRPHDDKTRKVTITFLFKPIPDMDAMTRQVNCESIDVGVEITSSVPKRTTQIYSMMPKKDGSLTFHPDLPRDPEGSTLYDVDKDTGEVK